MFVYFCCFLSLNLLFKDLIISPIELQPVDPINCYTPLNDSGLEVDNDISIIDTDYDNEYHQDPNNQIGS